MATTTYDLLGDPIEDIDDLLGAPAELDDPTDLGDPADDWIDPEGDWSHPILQVDGQLEMEIYPDDCD